MEEQKTEVELEAERDAEFEKLAAGDAPSQEPKDEPKADPESKKEDEPESGKKEGEATPPNKEPEKSEGEPKTEKSEQDAEPEPKGDDAGIAKALKDTKAWATKLSMEKADLEKRIAALEAGGGTKEKVEEAKAAASETRKVLDEKIKKASEDYPELKEVLDLVAKTSMEALSKVQDFDKKSAEDAKLSKARQHFETEVEPEIVKVHPDFRKVAFSEEYIGWLQKQSPAMQFAGFESLDPGDIGMTLTEFKKFKASGAAEKDKSDNEKRKDGLRQNLSSIRGGGSGSKGGGKPTKLEDVDPNDRDAAFDFLAEQEAYRAKGK